MRAERAQHAFETTSARTVWVDPADDECIRVIDQRRLPSEYAEVEIRTVDEMASAISAMTVRGAGCIGVAAGFGMYLAVIEARDMPEAEAGQHLRRCAEQLVATRPTAVNLAWAVLRQRDAIRAAVDAQQRIAIALATATAIVDEDIESCRLIGEHGSQLIREIHERTGATVRVLTHCNAGWLAFVQHGSATAPIYAAHAEGIPVHVLVSETRPRSQGALTAWELGRRGVPHTMITDNAIGHFLQRGEVDMVVVGADRVTMRGDTANKIGTYLRALAARAHDVPFLVALPSTTFDPSSVDGLADITIEERDPIEVTHMIGDLDGHIVQARVAPVGTTARNPAFDVTPAELISGLITERGICAADTDSIAAMFPELVAGRRA